ncbi:Tigger transposable element-derived protein 6 [Anthophora quadrimaculata]
MSLRVDKNGFGLITVMRTIKKDLFIWICEKHATNSFLDRQTLREKVLELTRARGLNGFHCSDRWLTCFLKSYGFSTDPINHVSPKIHDYRGWIDLMRSLITKYKHEDLFHADELTMYSDIRPSRTKEYSEGSESPRDRITILMSCNSSGTTKLPLLICGPYSSRIKAGEHVYCHSKDSYIRDELFKDWLLNVNDRMGKCDRRILLFLRRNRAHALKDFVVSNNVQLVYLPEDFPPLLRPLRRDVFHYVKMVFRRRYVERVKNYRMEWQLPDILASLIKAWETLPQELIVFNFQRTRFRTDDTFLQINYDSWDSTKMGMPFKTFVTFDDDLSDDKVTHGTNNRYHSYNLRTNSRSKNVILIRKNGFELVPMGRYKIRKAKARYYKRTIPPLELRNRIDQKLDCNMTKRLDKIPNDKHRNARQSSLKGNPIEQNRERRKSLKRTYSRTQFSTKGRSGERCAFGDESIKNSFLLKDRNVRLSRSIRRKVFKEAMPQRHQLEMNIIRVSLRAIIDKALTLMSSTKAECTQKVINNIYAFNQEATNDHLTQPKRFNEQDNLQSKFLNKVSTKLPGNFDKFNQPSTFTNNSNNSWEGIEQSASVEAAESQAASFSAFESNRENHGKSQNSNLKSFVVQEALRFTMGTARKSPELSDSGDSCRSNRSRKNKAETDHNWSKQFETTFIFGSPVTNCSLNHQPDENIDDPCILNVRSLISPRE